MDASTPTDQGGRLFRDGVPSTCSAPKAFSGSGSTSSLFRHVTSMPLHDRAASTVCATIVVTPDVSCDINVFASAYLGSYCPSSLPTNYLGDMSSSFGIPPDEPELQLRDASARQQRDRRQSQRFERRHQQWRGACTVTVASDPLFTEPPVSPQRFDAD